MTIFWSNDIFGYVSRAPEVSQSPLDIVHIRIAPKLQAAVATGKIIDRCINEYKSNAKSWPHCCKSLTATCGDKQNLKRDRVQDSLQLQRSGRIIYAEKFYIKLDSAIKKVAKMESVRGDLGTSISWLRTVCSHYQ